MPSDTASATGPPPTTDTSNDAGDAGIASNRTLVITLSSVLSVVGLVVIVGVIWICRRYRQRRVPFLSRGISPIDDDEIATWKSPRDEKAGFHGADTDVEADAALNKETGGPSHTKHASTSSVKKPPSVIVYSNAHGQGFRRSTDGDSPRSFAHNHPAYGGKVSLEKALPQTPIQARAPNARAGLTDETVPGDAPFLPSPRRQPSRLSKFPPNSASQRRGRHARARSSRSSTRSFGEYGSGGSDMELSPRHSHDHVRTRNHSGSHSRVYSSSSIPPRLSFGDEALFSGVSPGRPSFQKNDIGRALG
ncbi:Mid2 domain-containing protein [Madurella fahalii]|uniref:Mid2 domain-containing protein n=1 Tax=Madurella fahalii TaxID=1157608 RepID=A0ABQ0G023_9PEZI